MRYQNSKMNAPLRIILEAQISFLNNPNILENITISITHRAQMSIQVAGEQSEEFF